MSEMTEAAMSESEVRAEVREFLEANWDVNRSLLEWRNILVAVSYTHLTLPTT